MLHAVLFLSEIDELQAKRNKISSVVPQLNKKPNFEMKIPA
jgi:hypothetical protein